MWVEFMDDPESDDGLFVSGFDSVPRRGEMVVNVRGKRIDKYVVTGVYYITSDQDRGRARAVCIVRLIEKAGG